MGKAENIAIEKKKEEKIAALNDGILKDYAIKKLNDDAKKEKKATLFQAIKYFLCAASAGAIQMISFTLLQLFVKIDKTMWFMVPDMNVGDFLSTTIALALSIIWNFTLNRKFTFKDAGNVPKAMALAFLFYVPFYPFQTWYVPTIKTLLLDSISVEIVAAVIAEGTVMLINGILEFCWQKFVVFRKKKGEVQDTPVEETKA